MTQLRVGDLVVRRGFEKEAGLLLVTLILPVDPTNVWHKSSSEVRLIGSNGIPTWAWSDTLRVVSSAKSAQNGLR